MPCFQLEIAVALVACSFVSLVLLYFNGPQEGKIQLPTHADAYADEDEVHKPDPFEVTRPEDIINGYPVNFDKFWMRICCIKVFMTFLLASLAVLSTFSASRFAVNDEVDEAVIYGLHTITSTYLLIINVHSLFSNSMDAHWFSTVYTAIITIAASTLLGITAILPNTPRPVASPVSNSVSNDATATGVWYAILSIYVTLCVVSFTTPLGPPLHYPQSNIYSEKAVQSVTNTNEENVCGSTGSSIWGIFLFSYVTKVVWLGNVAESLEIGDLPILPRGMRATYNYSRMKKAMRQVKLDLGRFTPQPGSGWSTGYRLIKVNKGILTAEIMLAVVSAVTFYAPAIFIKMFVAYLEVDPNREKMGWGWVYIFGLFASNATVYLITGQLWSLATTVVQVRLRIQMNTILFQKTLVRKDVASSAPPPTSAKDGAASENGKPDSEADKEKSEDDFSSKAQIMTLMTTDVDRVGEFAWHAFSLVDSPIEICIGALLLYNLLGVSCFVGLAATCLLLPLNHSAGKVVIGAQENLMKARDERISLMNEVLGGIRMLKFMAWERNFQAKVLKIREKELKYQKLNFTIEALLSTLWNGSPIFVTLVSFWHFTVVRGQALTPSIAFTSIWVFTELKFALNALPETFINMLQSIVSLRRIEKYLNAADVNTVPPLNEQSRTVALQSCTVTWPQDRLSSTTTPSAASTPRQKFVLVDLSIEFPPGELSLICGKLGSGKTLLLLALLGEADVLTGQLVCPHSPPDSLASLVTIKSNENWIVDGISAYVPQAAWLRNASIKENILFSLPYNEERYQKTLEACALVSDLEILEDGDESEIGERGVNLSGGQKARVSLARAVYSRASILLLDDVLSAVDAHTAHHLYHECLKGDLMRGRTVILVSHHVQLSAPGASYIVALDNGRVQFQGSKGEFFESTAFRSLVHSIDDEGTKDNKEETSEKHDTVEEINVLESGDSGASSTLTPTVEKKSDRKAPRKLIEEEKRAVGRIGRDIWVTYVWACGNIWYWALFIFVFIVASLSPVIENGWLSYWSNAALNEGNENPAFYISVYASITAAGLVLTTIRWFVLYRGSIHASTILYKRLLETILFANIRFHDTVSRGRLLNRFGKDFEGIDSSLSDNFGRSLIHGLAVLTTLITISLVGGPPFIVVILILSIVYYNVGKIYGQTSRDMRRLDSVTRSPLYSIYGETISGVTIIRSFGASSKFLRDMLRCVDTNTNPYYWLWRVNRWLSSRFTLLSSVIVGATGLACLVSPTVSASFAGFALAFASTITIDSVYMIQRFVALEQSMVALERVKEYSDLPREPPEFVEPRPAASWPAEGGIKCEDLVIRYAPDLPNVLHNLNFEVKPGEKIGILGRTGSGKSTLALSFFRFVEPTEGRILVDGIDISKIGLADLRSRLTIIPQDPTILSGSLRSTLDVFDEYEDAEIYEALRRVHLVPVEDTPEEAADTVNANVFRDLDSSVSEGGENFSTGEKQLLCMARAILKRSKVLVMDEATASVDYATDELIGKTIRQEFASSTILTIAHRLRTVIDYDRIMLLDQGKIVEFDKPAKLLSDTSSKFHALCKATGQEEFSMLKKMCGL